MGLFNKLKEKHTARKCCRYFISNMNTFISRYGGLPQFPSLTDVIASKIILLPITLSKSSNSIFYNRYVLADTAILGLLISLKSFERRGLSSDLNKTLMLKIYLAIEDYYKISVEEIEKIFENRLHFFYNLVTYPLQPEFMFRAKRLLKNDIYFNNFWRGRNYSQTDYNAINIKDESVSNSYDSEIEFYFNTLMYVLERNLTDTIS